MKYNVLGINATYLTVVTLTLSTAVLLTLLSETRTNGRFTRQTHTQSNTQTHMGMHTDFTHKHILHTQTAHLCLRQCPGQTYNYVRPFQASLQERH